MSSRIRAAAGACYVMCMERITWSSATAPWRIAAWVVAVVPVLLFLGLAACGSAPAVKLPDGGYARFARHATHPVVDTRAQSSIHVGLAHSRASWMLVHHFFDRGVRPPAEAIRVSEAIAAMVPPVLGDRMATKPWLSATVAPSPYRAGWQLLVISVTAPTTTTRLQWSVLSPARDVMTEAFIAGGATYVEGDVADLPRHLEGRRHIIVASDGAGFGGPEAQAGLLQSITVARRAGAIVMVVGKLGPGFDDALLAAIAEVGGGLYEVAWPDDDGAHRQLAQRLLGPIGLVGATLEVTFDATQVKRWRLVGHDDRSGGVGPIIAAPMGGLVPAGETVDVVFEVEGAARASVRLAARDITMNESLVVAPADERHTMVALVAAFAEKLSGSHWFADVPWSSLEAQLERVRSPAFKAELGDLISATKATP